MRNDDSPPTPGYTYYDYGRNDAASLSGTYTYPYTTPYLTNATRPTYQGANLSPEAAPEENHEKVSELTNNPFAFPPGHLSKVLNPESIASCKGLGGLNDLEQGSQTDVAGVEYSSVEPLATKNHPSKTRRVDRPSRSPGPAKPLWDPNNDDPTTHRSTRRDRQSGHVNSPFRRPYSSRGLRSKPRKPDVVREWSTVANLQEQTLSTDPYITQFDSSRKPRILGKQELRPGDGPSEGLETLPEMLLQPDTRPISHEQLVVEVKGIYASLLMVEAKCIDIDERQSAAAQEKVPSKKTDLKNDQWQSLIALHKQLLHEHHDSFLSTIYQDKPYNRPMQTLSPVESHSRVGSLLRTKQGLAGFANGSSIAAMADTGSRKNIMSASYAKKLDLKIEGLPSTFVIGNSRRVQSIGMYIYVYLSFFSMKHIDQ